MKAILHCRDAEINIKEGFTKESIIEAIDWSVIEIDYMPAPGESITLFNSLGWFDLTVEYRYITIRTIDSNVKPPLRGTSANNIYISKIEILETYTDKQPDRKI